MNSKRYDQLEKEYLKLEAGGGDIMSMLVSDIVDEYDYVPSNLTNDKNEYGYLKDTMRFWLLTHMHMEVQDDFYYLDEIYTMKSSVLSWIRKVIKKEYDRYLMTQIVLGYDCVYFWSLKKEFKFFFKKISDVDTMIRWIIRFIELAEKDGYYDFSTFFAQNALSEFEKHNILDDKTRLTLEKHFYYGNGT